MLDSTDDNTLASWLRATAQKRLGRDYIYESFDAETAALVVVDMQNYFMKPGFLAACPMAIDIVPAINRMAQDLRAKGGVVVWVQTRLRRPRIGASIKACFRRKIGNVETRSLRKIMKGMRFGLSWMWERTISLSRRPASALLSQAHRILMPN